jgi:serine phosphatase RsbU (regulator of sigma subunit)
MSAGETKPLQAQDKAVEETPADQRVKILVVDDEPRNLLALSATLAGLDVDLVKAQSGLEALRCLLQDDVALILMDVKMPGMDGFETAELIRQRERSKHTPIIFLTAFGTNDVQMFKGYALGAVDYLSKPLVSQVLRSKVVVFVDIFQKTQEVKRQAALLRQIEQREHQRQLAEIKERLESERLRQELHVARLIQQKLFPAAPLPLAGFDISGASYPAEATGGDYFDYIPLRDGSLGIVIGDVSGHGFGPALLMAETRAYLRAFLLTHTDVAEIIGLLNRALANDAPDDRFATLLFARLDLHTRSLVYASAGHTTGYLLDPSGRVKTALVSTGMPLAILPESDVTAAPALTLEPGEVILLLTDGIVEAHSSTEELFGVQRVLDLVQAQVHRTAREIVDALYTAARSFSGSKAPFDDMTAIVIKVHPTS